MSEQSELIYEGKHLRFLKAGRWEYVERVNAELAVVIVAETAEGQVIFIEQYRPPIGKNVIELPAGLVGDEKESASEPALEAARRELLEETGYDAEDLKVVAEGPISPGLSNETVALVRATGLQKRHEGGGVEHEEITVHLVPRQEAHAWLQEKEQEGQVAVDPKVYSGLYFLE